MDTEGRPPRPRVIVTVGPYLVLALAVVFTLVYERGPGLRWDLGLLTLLAGWMVLVFTLHPAWRDRPRVMGAFVAVVLVLVGVLVVREPWFGALAIAGYIYAFAVVPWPWRQLAVAAFAVLAATAQASSVPKDTAVGWLTYVAVVAVNVVALCAFARIHRASGVLSEQRRQALAENAVLHERLVEQARQAGVAEERRRMAREIHDTLAQGLVGIITQLQAADQDPGERQRHLDAATALARDSLREARRSVQALQPRALESSPLATALRDAAERWSQQQGIPVAAVVVGEPRELGADAETALLRAGNESLSNVARHARAGRVGVTLSFLPEQVILDVRDDGIGFDPASTAAAAPTPSGGFGLVAMRQRVRDVGGTVSIESSPSWGTVVSVAVPSVDEAVDEAVNEPMDEAVGGPDREPVPAAGGEPVDEPGGGATSQVARR